MNGAQPVSPSTSGSTSHSPISINLASPTLISIPESTDSNSLVQDPSTPTALPSTDVSEISLSEDLLASTSEDKDLGSHDDTVATADPDGSSLKQDEPPIVVQLEEATIDEATATGTHISEDLLTDGDHELKRVKVYELIGSRWIDQGTAFCFGQFQDETSDALLIARSESNYQEVILSTAIRGNDVYQRQQDTLIVWTEPDGVDYALSFQDPDGCSEVWNFILEVQRHMNGGEDQLVGSSSPLIGPEPLATSTSVTTASIIRSGHLPRPQLGIIAEIERAIKGLARTLAVKEKICEYIQQEDYIKSLIDVFNQAEDLESLENLHALCSLMQTILTLNDHGMYEHILEDDLFFGVVGILEYDPEFPTHKANYREFLHDITHFHQPIPISDIGIKRKIHHTYRLQFLKDVVLARTLDDATFNVLNSCIIFNQIDIITHVQQDHGFLRDVVRLYVDEDMLSGGGNRAPPQPPQVPRIGSQPPLTILGKEGEKHGSDAMDVDPKIPLENGAPVLPNQPIPSTSISRSSSGTYAFAPPDELSPGEIALRKEVVLLIQQLCVMGKNVQVPARMALFRSLVDRGVLFGVQWALSLPEKDDSSRPMISAGGEILAALLDHDLNGVRGHVLKQVLAIDKEREAGKKGADKAVTLLALLCRMLAQSRDLAIQSQVGDALKVWLDVPVTDGVDPHPSVNLKMLGRPKDDPGTEKFMEYFYKNCIDTLFKPFSDIPEFKTYAERILPLTRERTNLYLYLCDLLCNFALQHSFRSHFYMLSSNVSVRVATLLKVRDKHLRHAAFRYFRICLKLNNRNLQNHLIKNDVLKPILDLTLQESRRDNLLSSSCQEFFEHMRRENIKDLIKQCMTQHEAIIRKLATSPLGGPRFQLFIRRWEMNSEPLPEEKPDKPVDTRLWPGQGRAMEAEEEDYFNGDDDEDEFVPSISAHWTRGGLPGQSSPMTGNHLKRKRRPSPGGGTSKGFRPQGMNTLHAPILKLVDYGDDDDEDTFFKALQNVRKPFSLTSSTDPPPSSPKVTHQQISIPPAPLGEPPKRVTTDDDEEDNLLEALVRGKSGSPGQSLPSADSVGPLRPTEKRRRDDEDDELLERLSKAKKVDLGPRNETGISGRSKLGDDPPKKIKVKFGTTIFNVASASSTASGSSDTGAKDGDTG